MMTERLKRTKRATLRLKPNKDDELIIWAGSFLFDLELLLIDLCKAAINPNIKAKSPSKLAFMDDEPSRAISLM